MITPRSDMFVWIDLEMTGLDAQNDVIMEMATLVTDNQLQEIHEGPTFIIHQPESVLATMHPYVATMHATSKLTDAVRNSTTTIDQACAQTLAFIQTWCMPQTAPLCGNSIWQDATFLRKYTPSIMHYLHYRMLDVSAFKVAVHSWYPKSPYKEFKKKNDHRALTDIYESIEELRHYRKHFLVHG